MPRKSDNSVSSPPIPPIPDAPDDDLAENEVKLEVPGYRQMDDHSCGPVAAWSILQTFHPGSTSYHAFYADCEADEDGANEIQIIRALRMNRIGVGLRDEMTFKDLIKTIDRGFPILSSIRQRGWEDHWVCIYGYGLKPSRVFTCNHAQNGSHGRKEYRWSEWRRRWDPSSQYLICWGT